MNLKNINLKNLNFDLVTEKIKKLDPKYRYLIFGGALLLVFLINYFLLLGPLMGSLNKMSAKTSEIRQNLQGVKNDIARIDQNRAQLEKIRGQINEVKIKIRSKQEVPLILEDISRNANQTGVKIDQLMPLKDQQDTLAKTEQVNYFSLPILIQVRSSYHDLGRFLAQLEGDKIFYSLSGLSITANPKDATRQMVQLTIKSVISEKADKKTESKSESKEGKAKK
jgi:type IV pilus assembly protein PilO